MSSANGFTGDLLHNRHLLEQIVARRKVVSGGKTTTEYKIRWEGYAEADDTWEKEESLNCSVLLKQYNDTYQEAEKSEWVLFDILWGDTVWQIDEIWRVCMHWLIDWLIDWLVGWLIDWLIDWLVGWLVGWLWTASRPEFCSISQSVLDSHHFLSDSAWVLWKPDGLLQFGLNCMV